MPPRLSSAPLRSARKTALRAALFLALVSAASASVTEPSDQELQDLFHGQVQPFLQDYCLKCHDEDKPKADLDLSRYENLEAVVKDYSHWDLVLERLRNGDMPPAKSKKQPSLETRNAAIAFIQSVRAREARKFAGDPGPVLARRLSNAEYDYTILDLTGVDIRPTRTFPVDPANQAGFDNSGESLTMSPALVKKYLQAARDVAEHLVLKPTGFAFAPHPVIADTDRDKWSVFRIIDFYRRQPTDYADYFMAAWRFENRAQLGKSDAALTDIAATCNVSPKYLARIWSALVEAKEEVGPMARLQAMWRELPPAETGSPEQVRSSCEEMRNYVVQLRAKIIPEVKNLSARAIQGGSQTLVLWKDRQMAANRRRFDPTRLQTPELPPAQNTAPPSGEPAASPGATQSPAASTPPKHVQAPTPEIVKKGGFSLPPVATAGSSSATDQLAAARPRGADPDLLLPSDPAARSRFEAAFARFADLFPDAFYITERARVYLDAEKEKENAGRLLSAGLHSMTGYFRDDGPLYDLILDAAGQQELDRLWEEFDFTASVPQRMHTSFLWFERTDSAFMRGAEFDPYRPEDKSVTTQEKIHSLAEVYLAKAQKFDASETVQEAIREHFAIVATNIQRVEQQRIAAEPIHLHSVEDFAVRAYRRPLSTAERDDLHAFYREARENNGNDHEEAIRDCIVRILMSPDFCFRIDLLEAAGGMPSAAVGATPVRADDEPRRPFAALPLSEESLASRLSYFLHASMPDHELLDHAAAHDLHQPAVLRAQVQRMLRDPHIRNFATEFAGNWLDFRRFEEHNSVDRERFPAFTNELRRAMYEEPIRFFVDVVQEDRSILDFLYANDTFVNAPLAQHYGIPVPAPDPNAWVHVQDASPYSRGGLLPMSVFLTRNSPGLRTSPVKRGNWVVKRLLGERIPPPPATVPELPSDEQKLGELTLREALVRHRQDESCAACHARFDSFGLVFESFGPIGERRERDLGGRPVDTRAEFPGGSEGVGLAGLRQYIHEHREEDFLSNFCGKLLSYALGRTLIISDDPLLQEMRAQLSAHGNRFSSLIETIVTSPQFLTRRAPAGVAAN